MDSLKLNVGAAFIGQLRELERVAFTPENIHLGDYVFVPWVRTGLAAAIGDTLVGNRAVISARAEVVASDDETVKSPVSRDLTLYGPGDIAAIDPSQILRRYPTPGSRDAEDSYLAHIEFTRPDFPWIFSPKAALGTECEAWLALIVVEAAVSRLVPSGSELPTQIWTKKGQLQQLQDNAKFCHAQVVGAALTGSGPKLRGAEADTVETRLSDDHAPANLSRILCPRRLDDGVDYIAALVPAYSCGAQAGKGMSGGDLGWAWTRSAGDELDDIVLPAYDSWTFRTAAGGDFRSLAGRIKGVAAPWSVGRRFIDLSQPGGQIAPIPSGSPEGIQLLSCALFSPALNGPAPSPAYPVAQREAIRLRIDQANAPNAALPRVGARLYARYQRAASALGPIFGPPLQDADADTDWFTQLNTNPVFRIVAGIGARVVQKDQEQLMQSAWAQVEGVRRANQVIAWAGLAEQINISIMRRHIAPLDPGRMMQMTRNLHSRIRDVGQPRSLAAAVSFSRTAEATMSAAFRRATRPTGPVSKRAAMASPGLAVATQAGFLDHRRDATKLDGIRTLSEIGRAFFDAAVIAKVLNVSPRLATATLNAKLKVLADIGTASAQLRQTKTWQGPDIARPGDVIGATMLTEIDRFAATGVLAGRLAEVTVGLVNVGGGLASAATTSLKTLTAKLPKQDLRLTVKAPVFSGGEIAGPAPVFRPTHSIALPSQPNRSLRGTVAFPGGGRLLDVTPGSNAAPVIVDVPVSLQGRELQGQADAPTKRYETEVSRRISDAIATLNKTPVATLREQMASIVVSASLSPKVDVDMGTLAVTRTGVLAQIEPRATARAALKGRIIRLPDCIQPGWIDSHGLRPIMAAPIFNRAMYEALDDYDRDWLVPGLGEITERDFVTLLSINPGFAEAFLVGASDELGRELLWRDYPTDQRGTYFKRFWDEFEDELTGPIHRFSRQPIGRHFKIGGDKAAGAGALALVVRGELLRRFPDTVIAALRATSASGPPSFIAGSEAEVLFHAHLDPDYTLVGFNLTVEQVMSGGNWWFVLAQNPTAPRFGLATDVATGTSHNALDWADFGTIPPGGFLSLSTSFPVKDVNSQPQTVTWPGHAGTVARVLLTNPIRAAFRADRLINATQMPNS